MTDWNTEYSRNPSFSRQLAHEALLGHTIPVLPITENIIDFATVAIRERLTKELEPIIEQIQEYPISEDEIKRIRPTLGDRETGEHNSRMIGGDPNDYVTSNKTGYVQPVTKLVMFENKVRATPTTFSYAPVPVTAKVFPYPVNDNPFSSDRLVGSAAVIDLLTFDQMNARLGPTKRVNVILIGFSDRDSIVAQWQEASYVGGKKNDIVITWGGPNSKPTWVRAFGWTDPKTCLRQLESIVLENGAKTETLPLIEAEIIRDYRLKDWEKSFAHIRVPLPMWAAWWYFGVAIVGQIGFWWWSNRNEFDKV